MKNQQERTILQESSEPQSSLRSAGILRRIVTIRGFQVMLDRDIAELYGVPTGRLNEQVKRNVERFPERFMFQLTVEELEEWKSQFAISNSSDEMRQYLKMGVRHRPYAFTEQGVAMLSSVLHSQTAINIMDAFVAMRRYLIANGQVLQQIDQIRRQQILDQSRNDERFDTVFTALSTGNLLPNGILPASSEFDSFRYVARLIESAKSEIVLIDPYSDAVTLEVLAKKRKGVKVRLVCKNRGQPTPTEIAKFNRQYKDLTVTYTDDFHDRFLIIDNAELHCLGSSINCLGRRVSSYTTRDAKEIAKLLAMVS